MSISLNRAVTVTDVGNTLAAVQLMAAENIMEALESNPKSKHLTKSFEILWRAVVQTTERLDKEIAAADAAKKEPGNR